MEGYFEQVVDTLTAAGYRWYETANFCLDGARADGRDLRARHNLGYWLGRDYLGLGIGAVSTVGGMRRRNLPSLSRYVGALARGEAPPREVEPIDAETQLASASCSACVSTSPSCSRTSPARSTTTRWSRLSDLGMVAVTANGRGDEIRLTRRGRFLGGGVTAELLA